MGADSERFINAFINTAFAAFVGIGFLAWYAITKHWALVPLFPDRRAAAEDETELL